MKLSFGLCVTLVILLDGIQGLSAQEAKMTIWKGALELPSTKLRLEIQITDHEGKQFGTFISIDQGNATVKLNEVQLGNGQLRFSSGQLRATYDGQLNDEADEATGTFKQSGGEFPLTLTLSETRDVEPPSDEKKFTLREAWVGELDMGVIKPVMQFRVVNFDDGTVGAFFDSVTEGRTDFEAEFSIEDGQLKFAAPGISLTFEGELNEEQNEAAGTWKQASRSFPLTLKKQSKTAEVGNNVWEKRPQRPQPPFPYESIDVTFENPTAEITLAGTLTIPEGTGPFPAVILISGSGPQDRDETLMEHKPFLVLADYLSRRGIAVLRYDDRGVGKSTGDFSDATSADFATDTIAAIDFLKTRDNIDSEKIGMAGHSEGGLIAPMVASQRNDVAFVVLMAGPGVDGAKVISTQVDAMLRGAGMESEQIEREVKTTQACLEVAIQFGDTDQFESELEKAIDRIIAELPEEKQSELGEEIRTAIKTQSKIFQSKWMLNFLKYDPRPALRKTTCRLLAIIGSKDLQVVPNVNMPEIEKALQESGNPDYKIVVLEDLNHLFQKCETGTVGEYATIAETFNPAALQAIGDWIVDKTR